MSVKQVIKRLKTKLSNGSLSDDIPIGADAENVFFEDGHTLKEVVGEIDIDTDGTIAEQLANGGGGDSPIRVANTVNDMKQLTDLKAGDIVYTKGYNSVSDMGGARYLISNTQTSTDTGAMIGVNNGTQRATLFPETREVNVLQFGAGIGSDATQAFQNAINYCQTNRCKLLVPFGNYKITSPLDIKKSIEIEGVNPNSYGQIRTTFNPILVSLSSAPTGGAFKISNYGSSIDTFISIKNLAILSIDDYSYPCFSIDNGLYNSIGTNRGLKTSTILEGISIKNFGSGIRIISDSQDIIVRDVKTYFNKTSQNVYIGGNVKRCLFENCVFASDTTYTDSGDIVAVEESSAPAFLNCDFDSRLSFSYLTNNPTKFFNCDNTISQPY